MKYVVLGSLGNISKPLAEKLIASGHPVKIVSSKPERAEEIILMGAQAAIGSVEDVDFLTRTFIGADAIYTMIPPYFGASDWKRYIAGVGKNIADAIRASKVKNIVNLSSIGAHMPEGCGPVSGLHFAEEALNKLEGVNVRHLRPGFFYTNLLANIPMIQNMGIMGGNYGENATMILVHTNDIASVAAEELLHLSFRGKSIRYISSDEKTTKEVASILGKAIGKPNLEWVNFTDEDTLAGLIKAGLPHEVARNYTEMGVAMRSGEMASDYKKHRPTEMGRTKLTDFSFTFANAFNQSLAAAKSRVSS